MRPTLPFLVLLSLFVPGLYAMPAKAPHGVPAHGSGFSVRSLPLPGGGEKGIAMDYLAFDPGTGFVWVPAGNTGAVDIVDTASGKVTQVPGFASSEVHVGGSKRVLGPSAATVGDRVVYIGNRADATVCAVNARSFVRGACGHLDSMPDGLAFVATTGDVWATTPRDHSIRILDGATLAEKRKLTFDGDPEGFAVDAKRHRFYTNLEDKDQTLAIDLKTHETVATWHPACGQEGPHGLALDEQHGWLFVACSARVEVLDVGSSGAVLSAVDTGDGVDSIDYAPATRTLYVGAAKAAKLTIVRVEAKGRLVVEAQVPTPVGARNGVVVRDGSVYLAHSRSAPLNELVVVSPKDE